MKRCPSCDSPEVTRAIVSGAPVKLCSRCFNVWGFWAWLVSLLPFRGYVLTYTGSTLAALIRTWWKS